MRTQKQREQRSERVKLWRAQMIADRICYECGQPLPDWETHTRHEACRERHNAMMRERYQYMRMSGACQWCGRIAREGMVLCWDCSLKNSRMGAERRAAKKKSAEADDGERT